MLLSGLVSLLLLILSVANGVYLGYPLTISFLLLCFACKKAGKDYHEIWSIATEGGKKSLSVIQVLLLIGAMTALWMAGGTVGTLVSFSIGLISPKLFVLSAFLLSAGVSFLLGSAFGTASTIGVVLMVLAAGGGVNPSLSCGAILSGIYFGDRASPMSSSLNLLGSLSGTEHYANVGLMLKTAAVPMLGSAVLYLGLSLCNPIALTSSSLAGDLADTFRIGTIAAAPAAAILLLCLCRVNIKLSMALSLGLAALLAVFYQGFGVGEVFRFAINGFALPSDHALSSVIKGGGLLGMAKTAYIVFTACCIAGLLEKGGLLGEALSKLLQQGQTPAQTFLRTLGVAFVSAALGCNQVISIVITTQMMRDIYHQKGYGSTALVQDISQSSTLVAAIVPWNIAAMVPVAALGLVGVSYMPYMFYLYLSPLYNLICRVYKPEALWVKG